MGAVADAVLAKQGEVIGVIPRSPGFVFSVIFFFPVKSTNLGQIFFPKQCGHTMGFLR